MNLELEGIALSRDIPLSVRWLANPIVNRISISSMITTLQKTRVPYNRCPPSQAAIHRGMNLIDTEDFSYSSVRRDPMSCDITHLEFSRDS